MIADIAIIFFCMPCSPVHALTELLQNPGSGHLMLASIPGGGGEVGGGGGVMGVGQRIWSALTVLALQLDPPEFTAADIMWLILCPFTQLI